MIHIFVGTKAQFIKMAPIMQELNRRDIAYRFINAGQHAEYIEDLIRQFELPKPDVSLRKERSNINTLGQATKWTMGNLKQLASRRTQTYEKLFGGWDGICLIHGDTLTTLFSLLYAKRCGLEIAHVEAGLRSYHLFNPFPEELVRLIAMRYSDLLFAPSTWAFENLCRMGYTAKAVNVGGNTGLDAMRFAQRCANGRQRPSKPYAVATIHRVETIYSRSRLTMVTDLLERVARERKVLFVLHEPTRERLQHFDLYDTIQRNQAIETLPLRPYPDFVDLVAGADFVITDGGSIQEEAYFLDVPCLIMRSKTERLEGLGENAILSEFDQEQIERFFQVLPNLRRQDENEDSSPSSVIVDHLLPWV
jgi:UDP-N-acetylglucosamine 2-epimerase (non-hydrolysing)